MILVVFKTIRPRNNPVRYTVNIIINVSEPVTTVAVILFSKNLKKKYMVSKEYKNCPQKPR